VSEGISGRHRDEPLWSRGEKKPVNWLDRERLERQVRSIEVRAPMDDEPLSRDELVEQIHRIYRRPGR
jgi:hypothetical protein